MPFGGVRIVDQMISYGAKLKQLANATPGWPAVTCQGVSLTYSEFHRRTNRLARGLALRGVTRGALVTVGLPNGLDFVAACWAIWKLGATPQPISFRLPAAELAAIIELANPALVIAEGDAAGPWPSSSIAELAALSDDEADLPEVTAPTARGVASGGSTGRPKLILSGGPGVTKAAMLELSFWRMRRGGVSILPAPLYHTAGFAMMLDAINIGAHLVILPRFDPEGVLSAIHTYRADWIFLVPTMMTRIWRLPDVMRTAYDLSSLKTLWHLAAPCPPWLKEAFIGWVGPDAVMERYGGAESQAISEISGREWLDRRGSVGRVIVGEMIAVGEDGQALPPGEVGEIYLRRPQGSPETYRYVGAVAKTLPGGWESLGDMGWFDADGYLYLADRRTDMILVGGANVYPAEVEAALEEYPAVQSCAIIGLPDDDLGNRIHAIVNVRTPVTSDQLSAHLADRLVAYKLPRSFEFVDEPIRDDAGKVRRTALRDERIARMKADASLSGARHGGMGQ